MTAKVSLRELRAMAGLSQKLVADRAGKNSQTGFSRLERKGNTSVRTLRSYVEACGGELRLIAVFPGGEIELELRAEEEA